MPLRPGSIGQQQKRAVVEIHFVNGAFLALPDTGIAEMLEAAESDLHGWAVRWHVQAPCMLLRAEYCRNLAQSFSAEERDRFIRRKITAQSGAWPRPPEAWGDELGRLVKMPRGLIRTASEKVAPTYRAAYRTLKMSQQGPKLVDDPDFLPSLDADPLIETREHFLERAGDHYDARRLRLAHVAETHGFDPQPFRAPPQLANHVDWLVRFQIERLSAIDIAKHASLGVGGDKAVRKAIGALAGLIELELRREKRGRPRRS